MKTILLLIILVTSLTAYSDQITFRSSYGAGSVSIAIPASLQLLEVDGKKFSPPSLASGFYQLKLQPGYHQLVLQYLENWNDNDDAGFIVEWQPGIIQAELTAGGYLIQLPQLEYYEQAEALINKPDIRLTPIHIKSEAQPTRAITLAQFTENRLISERGRRAVSVADSDEKSSSPLPFESEQLRRLKSLWQEASQEEKKAFWRWLGP